MRKDDLIEKLQEVLDAVSWGDLQEIDNYGWLDGITINFNDDMSDKKRSLAYVHYDCKTGVSYATDGYCIHFIKGENHQDYSDEDGVEFFDSAVPLWNKQATKKRVVVRLKPDYFRDALAAMDGEILLSVGEWSDPVMLWDQNEHYVMLMPMAERGNDPTTPQTIPTFDAVNPDVEDSDMQTEVNKEKARRLFSLPEDAENQLISGQYD